MTEKPKVKKRRILLKIALAFLFLASAIGTVLLVSAWTPMGSGPDADDLKRFAKSPQRKGDVFENPQPLWNDELNMITEAMSASADGSPSADLPVVQVDPTLFKNQPSEGLRVTWLGHSTTLIEIDGHRFLTDPVWGKRTSPISWLGPERWYDPLLAIEDLPKLDAVLISHDHYDHLDYESIIALSKTTVTFVVPLGVANHLEYWGVPKSRIVELDWWEAHTMGDIKITATPSRHASGRHIFDQNRTLWCGFALHGPKRRVFFSGDTGIFPGMKDIGNLLGPFDIVMVEIGAYGQSWPDWHIGPEQAIEAHQMLKGNLFVPIHWGLFNLAYHSWTEPVERVLLAAKAANANIAFPRPGESVEWGKPTPVDPWWPRDVPWRPEAEYPIHSTGM